MPVTNPSQAQAIVEPTPNELELITHAVNQLTGELKKAADEFTTLIDDLHRGQNAVKKLETLISENKTPKAVAYAAKIHLPDGCEKEGDEIKAVMRKAEKEITKKLLEARKKVLTELSKKRDDFALSAHSFLDNIVKEDEMGKDVCDKVKQKFREAVFAKVLAIEVAANIKRARKANTEATKKAAYEEAKTQAVAKLQDTVRDVTARAAHAAMQPLKARVDALEGKSQGSNGRPEVIDISSDAVPKGKKRGHGPPDSDQSERAASSARKKKKRWSHTRGGGRGRARGRGRGRARGRGRGRGRGHSTSRGRGRGQSSRGRSSNWGRGRGASRQ